MEAAPSEGERSADRMRFVEAMGVYFEEAHLPRMAGRIFAALLIGPASGMTAGELAETLGASKASISSNTRLLLHYAMVSRTFSPIDRRDRFVTARGAGRRHAGIGLEMLAPFRRLLEQGFALLDDNADPRPLTEFRDLYLYLEAEWPALLSRWEEGREPG